MAGQIETIDLLSRKAAGILAKYKSPKKLVKAIPEVKKLAEIWSFLNREVTGLINQRAFGDTPEIRRVINRLLSYIEGLAEHLDKVTGFNPTNVESTDSMKFSDFVAARGRRPKYTYKDFFTGKLRFTRGKFLGWFPGGFVGARYAGFDRGVTALFIPEYSLTPETRAMLAKSGKD